MRLSDRLKSEFQIDTYHVLCNIPKRRPLAAYRIPPIALLGALHQTMKYIHGTVETVFML